jgi:Tol biopolymer transport system component
MRKLLTSAAAAALLITTGVAARNWNDWAPVTNISSINTDRIDGCGTISPDGLELWFTSNRLGSLGATDIYVASRTSAEAPWGDARNVGAPINSSAPEACPTMTRGGRLYFTSQRPPDAAGDLYVIRRTPQGWGTLERLGANVNRPGSIEESATVFEDGNGDEVMLFSSNRGGRNRIYQSVNGGPADLVRGGVNTETAADARPTVSKDGLEIFFDSTRWSPPNVDLATARRSSTSDDWGTAERLSFSSAQTPGTFGAPGFDARPSIGRDGSEMVFASNRLGTQGAIDLWTTTRSKRTGQK